MTTFILCTYILKFSTLFKFKIIKMLLSTHSVDFLVGCVACVWKPQEVVQDLLSQEQTFPVSRIKDLLKVKVSAWYSAHCSHSLTPCTWTNIDLGFWVGRLRQKAQMRETFWKPLKWRHMLWLVMAKQVFLETSRPLSPTGSSDHGAEVTCCLLFHFHRIRAQGNNFRSRLIKYETLLLGSRMRSKEGVWSSTHALEGGTVCPSFFSFRH